MKIADKNIGADSPTFVIAEVAQSHDGSLGIAYSFIDAAAEAGADAIKFQTHIASEESTLDEQFRVKFSRQDNTRYDYWKRMEFTKEQWHGLASYAKEKGIIMLSSPFSVAAFELLKEVGMPAWKVGSGEVNTSDLIDLMINDSVPVLMSTGMSNWAEIQNAVENLTSKGSEFVLMQCTSKYPTPMKDVGLNVIEEYKSRFGCSIGLSDHSGTVYPSLAAIARGCDVLEVHVTFSKTMFGPDVPASLTFEELKQVCEFRDKVQFFDQNPVDKDAMSTELKALKALFGKSLALKENQKAGTTITRDILTFKKPADGIPAKDIESVVGKTLVRDVYSNRLLKQEDLND